MWKNNDWRIIMLTKLVVIGGFLGAGKTSAIARLGKMLIDQGKKVGIVTNDQGKNLVDTNFLSSEGLPVFEVTGGCFCCNFDEFTRKLEMLVEKELPEIILAEPVGSCTDLIATIFKPIMNNYTKKFIMSPLSVVTDPRRVKRCMLEAERENSFSNEINYLFDKQLQEADIIAINKIDLLSPQERDQIREFLKSRYKGATIVEVSALTGSGIEDWFNLAVNNQASQKPSMDIDYDKYAKAEAALGWLNTFALLTGNEKVDANAILTEIINGIKFKVKQQNCEIAHLKVYAVSSLDYSKMGVTGVDEEITVNRLMQFKSAKINLIINARVEIEPNVLQAITEETLDMVCAKYGMMASDKKTESFAPSYPNPKYRMV